MDRFTISQVISTRILEVPSGQASTRDFLSTEPIHAQKKGMDSSQSKVSKRQHSGYMGQHSIKSNNNGNRTSKTCQNFCQNIVVTDRLN